MSRASVPTVLLQRSLLHRLGIPILRNEESNDGLVGSSTFMGGLYRDFDRPATGSDVAAARG